MQKSKFIANIVVTILIIGLTIYNIYTFLTATENLNTNYASYILNLLAIVFISIDWAKFYKNKNNQEDENNKNNTEID